MKRILYSVMALGLLATAGCQREAPFDTPEEGLMRTARLGTVPILLDGAEEDTDTKSVVSTDVEGFVDAYLFAFWADSKTICTTSDGGATKPVALYTQDKSFDWPLPVGRDAQGREQRIDVWAIVNAGADIRATLDSYVSSGTSLTEAALSALNYTCANTAALQSLESSASNMPMSGMRNDLYLESSLTPLSLTLRRLFARYDIRLNTSRFVEEGWRVQAASITGSRSNTVAPYFYTGEGAGFRQSDASKFATVDYGTASDVENLNDLGENNKSNEFATFYFLENCQGDIFIEGATKAESWSTVRRDLGDKVANCTFLDVAVIARKSGYDERRFTYRLYLGQGDMRSCFDVIRNKYKKVTLTLSAPSDGFVWTSAELLEVAPGETVVVPFETSLSSGELFFVPPSCLTETARVLHADNIARPIGSGNGERRTDFKYYGSVTFSAAADAPEGVVSIIGQDEGGDICGTTYVEIKDPYYAGFRLGRLPLTGALGFPVTAEQATLLMNDYYKCVDLPTAEVNPHLWEGVGSTYWRIAEAFIGLYDVDIEYISSAEGAYEPNVKLWHFAQGDQPRFYYGADERGTPSSVQPALCKVKIHAKADPDPAHWVDWFEFANLIQYEYGYFLSASNNGTDTWEGRVSFSTYALTTSLQYHGSTNHYVQRGASLYDLHPMVSMIVRFQMQPITTHGGSATVVVTPGANGTAPCEVLHSPAPNPMYTVSIQDGSAPSGTIPSTGNAYSFPSNYSEYFTTYNSTLITVLGLTPSLPKTGDWYILPSHYLTTTVGGYDSSLSFFPGLLLRPRAGQWDTSETGSGNAPDAAPYSQSSYHVSIYPDASYETSSIAILLNGLKYPRKWINNFGIRITTQDRGDYPIKNISYDGNATSIMVDGENKNFEKVIKSVLFVLKDGTSVSFLPKASDQTRPFIWNNWAGADAAGAYCGTLMGFVTSEDTRPPVALKGWPLPNGVTWDTVSSVQVSLQEPLITYYRDGQATPFNVGSAVEWPAIGGYD